MLAFFAIDLLLLMLPSKLMITGHEGDLMHLADAALRMASGERPHIDFMTPIGILGFAPVAGFLALGVPIGKATLLAGASILALMLPIIWWVAATRFSKGQAYYFASIMVITMMAVVYGGGSNAISLSMYYNRWGWSIAFLVLATILFAPHRKLGETWVAPLVIGLGMATLAMLKMTFFVPLFLALPIILLAKKQGRLLLKAVVVGLVAGGAALLILGPDFFLAYLGDLLAVMRPESSRVNTGVSLSDLVASSKTIVTSIILFAALILFRKTGHMHQGLVVLVLAPTFAYITYQNWGNDPKWLHLVILYIWVNLPNADAKNVFGLPGRQGALALIVAAITISIPSVFSMATSPIRVALALKTDGFIKVEMIDGTSDIWLPERKATNIYGVEAMSGWPTLSPHLEPLIIAGRQFPDCSLEGSTILGLYSGMAAQLEASESVRGRPVLVADVLSFLWIMGDIDRVKGAAPWYYGDDSGVAGAEFIAVPFCPAKPALRSAMMGEIEKGGYELSEVLQTELMVLYRISKPAE